MGAAVRCCQCKQPNKPQIPNPNVKQQYKGVEITMIEGELADAVCEAIVNSCEKPYSPQASYIMKKAGDELQQQLKSQPSLKTGQVQTSGPGLLKCHNIIHVALPIWTGGEDGASADLVNLRHCYIEVMKASYDLKIKNMAFSHNCGMPALRPPSILHSQAIILAICSYLDEKPKDSKLEKISIYTSGIQSVRIYELLVQNRIDLNNQRVLKQRFREMESKFYITTSNGIQEPQKVQSDTNKQSVSKMDDIKLQFQSNPRQHPEARLSGNLPPNNNAQGGADALGDQSSMVKDKRNAKDEIKQFAQTQLINQSMDLEAQRNQNLANNQKSAILDKFQTNLDIKFQQQAPIQDLNQASHTNIRDNQNSPRVFSSKQLPVTVQATVLGNKNQSAQLQLKNINQVQSPMIADPQQLQQQSQQQDNLAKAIQKQGIEKPQPNNKGALQGANDSDKEVQQDGDKHQIPRFSSLKNKSYF